ncbi:MAG: gamma-glutamylcyclotransferase [Rubripirellula sp.]|nr:gamma-glutamylcyclotransferase [Rubripirellula sp.]
MKYFAYGSNCSPAVMHRKGIAYRSRRAARLVGFELQFNKRASRGYLPSGIGYANIGEQVGAVVEGALYEIAEVHLAELDRSERFPDHYRRRDVVVETSCGHTVSCVAYQAAQDKVARGLCPTRTYLEHLLAAEDLVTAFYLEKLKRIKVFEGKCDGCSLVDEVFFIQTEQQVRQVGPRCHRANPMPGVIRG